MHREKLLRIEFLKIALPVSNSLHLSLAVSQHEKTANFLLSRDEPKIATSGPFAPTVLNNPSYRLQHVA